MEEDWMNRRLFLLFAASAPAAALALDIVPQLQAQCVPTTSDLEGPYYLPNAPNRTELASLSEPGQRLIIRGKVSAADCKTAIGGVLLDLWQADASGQYHNEDQNYKLRGQMRTDKNGVYEFASIVPGRYRQGDGFRPAHIHFVVSHPHFKELTTQLYFEGDPYLSPYDSCRQACGSDDPDRIIKLVPVRKQSKSWLEGRFDIVLRSDVETA
jgi:protocatechuate 3,4-dioxygenase beta subunit